MVDNASGDGTAEMVRREFPQVELTENATNLGFGRANNPALAAGEAPYALVLNPDTRVTAGALDALVELMESRPEVGIAGPRLELEDGSLDHASRRSFPTPLRRSGTSPASGAARAPRARSPPTGRRRSSRARSTRSTAPSC